MVPVICAPETKFMEPMDKDRGKSDIKDKTKILKERTRSYVRDNELVELTLKNNDHTAQKKQWIKADGSVRKKIDDI